jgi:hypothetical protein
MISAYVNRKLENNFTPLTWGHIPPYLMGPRSLYHGRSILSTPPLGPHAPPTRRGHFGWYIPPSADYHHWHKRAGLPVTYKKRTPQSGGIRKTPTPHKRGKGEGETSKADVRIRFRLPCKQTRILRHDSIPHIQGSQSPLTRGR